MSDGEFNLPFIHFFKKPMLNHSKLMSSIFCTTLLVVGASCKNNLVTPTDDVKPGSRNYTWTVDTVYGPFNPFFCITGTSPTDLWTANPGDGEKIFYHYGGLKWTTDLVPRPFSPFSIYSVSPISVWSVGLQGRIWHFDGNQWVEQSKFALSEDTEIYLQDVFEVSQSEVYAVGACTDHQEYWGIILRYDGSRWNQINIPKFRTLFAKIRKDSNGKFYLWGVTNEDPSYQFYEFDGGTLTEILSSSQSTDQLGSMVELGDKIGFIIGYDLCSYSNGSFSKIRRLTDLPEFLNVGFGRTIKDIFLGMRNGIAHYNGTDTEYLLKTENNTYVRYGIVFEKDVFMMGRDLYGNNLIYHGKLTE